MSVQSRIRVGEFVNNKAANAIVDSTKAIPTLMFLCFDSIYASSSISALLDLGEFVTECETIVLPRQFRPSYSKSLHSFLYISKMDDGKRKRNDDPPESKTKRNAVDNNNKPTHASLEDLTEGGKCIIDCVGSI